MKTLFLAIFIALSFSACVTTSLFESSDYFVHTDYKGKKSFSKTGKTTPIFRCEETKNDECLLFDRDGDFLNKKISPDKCFNIRGNKYCPVKKLEEPKKEKEPKQKKKTKENKIKEVVEEIDKKEPQQTYVSKFRAWLKKKKENKD